MPTLHTSKPRIPSCRQRPGYDQALVTLTDSVTGQRRDYWLGEAGTRESRELYHRVIAAWKANGRRLPRHPRDESVERAQDGPVIIEVIGDFLKWARVSVDTGELQTVDACGTVAHGRRLVTRVTDLPSHRVTARNRVEYHLHGTRQRPGGSHAGTSSRDE
jgi:hypothetical protein